MRHFRFFSDRPLILSIAQSLIKQKGVTHTFKPYGDKENMGFKIGEYDIYVDDTIYDNEKVFELLKDYEILEINRKEYEENLNLREKYPYKELLRIYNEYQTLVEKQEEHVKECLKEQRKKIFQDVLKEYEEDIKSEVENRVYNYIQEFRYKFANEECPYEDLNKLYKKYIDAEIKMALEDFVNKYFTYKKVGIKLKFEDLGKSMIEKYFKEFRCVCGRDEVARDIKKFKNDLVDAFMKVSGHERGHRDYMLYLKRAGRLADLIENKLWYYYGLSQHNLK